MLPNDLRLVVIAEMFSIARKGIPLIREMSQSDKGFAVFTEKTYDLVRYK